MKSLILFLFSLISVRYSISQMVVNTQTEDILYLGINNYLEIAVNDQNISNLKFKINKGSLIHLESIKFVWKSCDTTLKGLVTISCFRSNSLIAQRQLIIKYIPNPVVNLTLPKGDFAPNDDRPRNFRLYIPNWFLGNNYIAKQYNVIIEKINGTTISLPNATLRFNAKTLTQIEQLNPGDKLKISDLIVQDSCTQLQVRLPDSNYFIIK